MTHPFQSKKFKELKRRWDQKLRDSGFTDAEEEKGGETYLKAWHSSYFKCKHAPERFLATQRYYELALGFLYDHPFRNRRERKIWALHAEGISLRMIALRVNLNLTQVFHIVRALKAKMLRDLEREL